MKILGVNFDPHTAQMLENLAQIEGYQWSAVGSGQEGVEFLEYHPVNLVLLGWDSVSNDALDICRQIRTDSRVPIIILSTRQSTAEIVAGLEAGADDYITKPFRIQELLARIEAVVRRGQMGNPTNELILKVGDWYLDPIQHTVTIEGGRTVELTPLEQALLHYLMCNAGKTVSRSALMRQLSGRPAAESNWIEVYIRRLRQKLEKDPQRPRRIITVRGKGYRFNASERAHS